MKVKTLIVVGVLVASAGLAQASIVPLGTAAGFAVLGGSTVTNTGSSTIRGNVGVWPGTSITGFPPGSVTGGTIHGGDAAAHQAQIDTTTAYNFLAGMSVTQDLTGQNLGNRTLTPGTYRFSSSAQLTGTLTLNALGDPNALFVFQMGSTLTTASSSMVQTINGADECNVFWQVGSSATLGTDTSFAGSIVALTSITLNTRASINMGRALARNGAVTLDDNHISTECDLVPLPGAAMLALPALLGMCAWRSRAARSRLQPVWGDGSRHGLRPRAP